jgi:excisionase family DNA binding protein
VHRNTVYRLIETGQLPALQLGTRGYNVRVDENELDAWLYDQGDAA